MFNPAAAFRPDPDRSPQWNRGAYLAEAMAHCGECHTPRNLGFALDNRHKFAGATTNGWRAFNISADKETGIGGWTDEALASYLSTGFADGHGVATGPMGEAVDLGLRHLTPDDIRALVRSEEHTSELQSLMRISSAVFCLKHTQNAYTLSTTTKTDYI